MWIILLVAASLLTIASAGVGVVTPEVEAEAHRLWEQFCADKREEASIGEMGVYCKFSQDEFQQTYSHELRIAPNPVTKKQVIFIRPATYIYKHDIDVTGGGTAGQKTLVYVLPSKNKNEVTLHDQTNVEIVTQKPTVYFLKKDHGDHQSAKEHGASHQSARN